MIYQALLAFPRYRPPPFNQEGNCQQFPRGKERVLYGNYRATVSTVFVNNGNTRFAEDGQIVSDNKFTYLNSGNSPGIGCAPFGDIPVQLDGTFRWAYTSTCPINNDVCTITFAGNGFIESNNLRAPGIEKWICQSTGNFVGTFNQSYESTKTESYDKALNPSVALEQQFSEFIKMATEQ